MEEIQKKKRTWFYAVDQRFPQTWYKSILFIPRNWKGWLYLVIYYGLIFGLIMLLDHFIKDRLFFKIIALIIICPAIFFSRHFMDSKSEE